MLFSIFQLVKMEKIASRLIRFDVGSSLTEDF